MTRPSRHIFFSITLVFLLANHIKVSAQVLIFESTSEHVGLLELYTSEGCSSCPPAERWFSQLTNDPGLWKTRFPIAFHVDYWDYLGWQDPFAQTKFSERQRLYQHFNYISSVATPGFIVDGKGWSGWFRSQKIPLPQADDHVGILRVELSKEDNKNLTSVSFSPTRHFQPLSVNVALLGFDITVPIKSGENRGRNLKHDFVVLKQENITLKQNCKKERKQECIKWQAQLETPRIDNLKPMRQAMIFWVSEANDPRPIQVVGGWL